MQSAEWQNPRSSTLVIYPGGGPVGKGGLKTGGIGGLKCDPPGLNHGGGGGTPLGSRGTIPTGGLGIVPFGSLASISLGGRGISPLRFIHGGSGNLASVFGGNLSLFKASNSF